MYVNRNKTRPKQLGLRVNEAEKEFIKDLTDTLEYDNTTDMILEALKLLKQSKQQQNYENR